MEKHVEKTIRIFEIKSLKKEISDKFILKP